MPWSCTFRSLTTFALLCTLSACTFVADPAAPPLEVPASFSSSGEEPRPEQWWKSFADPDLDALTSQALEGNLDLRATWARLDQARATARKAGADLVPSLDAEAGFTRNRTESLTSVSYANNVSAKLVASYELDLWGRVRSERSAALLEAQASQEDLATAAITLSAEVASNWYQLVDQYGQRKLLQAQAETNSDVLELLSLQFRTGSIGIADVLQQRQLLEATRGEMSQVASRIAVLETTLGVLVGKAPGEVALPARAEIVDLPPLPVTGLPAELVERRPDVRRAWLKMRAADHRVASAIATRFPRIGLGGQVGSSAATSSELFDNWLSSLAANLTLPLIDGGSRRADVERTRAAAQEALYVFGQAVLEAFAEVENALAGEAHQREYLESLERQLLLASQAIERIRDRYLNGAENYERVLTALFSYQNLQRRQLTARRELVEYRIALCRALAGGWELQRNVRMPASTEN